MDNVTYIMSHKDHASFERTIGQSRSQMVADSVNFVEKFWDNFSPRSLVKMFGTIWLKCLGHFGDNFGDKFGNIFGDKLGYNFEDALVKM